MAKRRHRTHYRTQIMAATAKESQLAVANRRQIMAVTAKRIEARGGATYMRKHVAVPVRFLHRTTILNMNMNRNGRDLALFC